MKRRIIFNVIISLSISLCSSAQKEKIKFHSINLAGIVGGASQVNSFFQTINGINFSNWYAGIGIGVDNYRYKTLPVFFDSRRYFGNKNKAFAYVDLGYNFPWKNKPGKEISYYNSYHFTGGIYTDIGIGYQFKLKKKAFFLFSLGHSYKKLQTKIGVTTCPFVGPCFVDYSKYDFGYGRMVLKAGLVF